MEEQLEEEIINASSIYDLIHNSCFIKLCQPKDMWPDTHLSCVSFTLELLHWLF